MAFSRSSTSRRGVLAVLMLCAARSAQAQFTDKVTTTPVLIQDGFGRAGDQLPYGGLEYCCPTSVSMSLLYLGVNGFNQIGPGDPTSADGLNLVRVLSGMMGTGPTTGTTSNTKFAGAISTYLNAKGISSADFTLTTYTMVTLSQLAAINQPGTTVDLVSGYYVPSGNTYVRTGGHCVALLNQGVDAQGQSSPGTLIINNPLPGALGPPSDVSGNALEYLNTVPTTGALTADGNMVYDSNQFPGYWGTARDVVETAFALTVNPDQQSANNPALATWNISTVQQVGPNGGNFSVLAPLQGTGGLALGTWGTVELEKTNDTSGTNNVIGGTLRSDIASGRPFGTGTIQLQAGMLQMMPTTGLASVSLPAADGAGNQITFAAGCTIALDRNGNNSLVFQFGGNSGGATANLIRNGTGTLVIVPGSGNANLGTSEQIIINGTGANLPAVTNGIVPPYIVSQDNDVNSSGDFVTYSANGFTRANYTDDSSTSITSTTAATVYRVQVGQSVPSNSTATVYAINVGSSSVGGGSSSTLNVGPQAVGQVGVILNGGTISTTNLNFGPAEGLVYASAAGGTITSVVQGTGGLTTFGPGSLTIKGNNTFSGTTNINSGSFVAQNTAGSATGISAVKVQQNATLEVRGASANVGSAAGTTVNFGGTLLLNGGSVTGPLAMNFGSYLFGQGTVNGAATVAGTIGSSGTDFGASPFAGVENIVFTGALTMNINTIYDWRLNALDATPADAGTNWSLLKFTGPSNVNNQIDMGTPNNPIHITVDLGSNVPDPNSGNAFWNIAHQWQVASATNGFWSLFYDRDFPTFSSGFFWVSTDGAVRNLFVNFTPTANTWNLNANGNWTAPGNWTGYVPNSVNASATFGANINAPRTITVDAPQTAGILNFTSPIAYTIAGTNPITLSASGGQAAINITAGNHSISAPLSFSSNTTVTTAVATALNLAGPLKIAAGDTITLGGGGNVTLAGTITAGPGSALNSTAGTTTFNTDTGSALASPLSIIAGGGAVVLASTEHLANLSIVAGAIVTASLASPHSVIVTGALTNSGLINLTNNDFILQGANGAIASANLTSINNQLDAGFNAGHWNGATGIVSTQAAGDTRFLTTLGYRQSAGGLFDGTNTTANDVLVKYTYYGDADLNGTVNGADYQQIDMGYAMHLTGWQNGDFNYDGVVDGSDFSLIDNTFNQINATGALPLLLSATPTNLIAAGSQSVPEPMSLGLLGIGAATIILGRRRRKMVLPLK
jgi:autotransporter-associated beta strand protein